MNADKGSLAGGGCALIGLLALLAFGGLASSVASSTAGIASSVSFGASSVASSMAIGDAVKAMSEASIASSAAINAANFNVTGALCLGGMFGVFGLLAGAGVAYVVLQLRRNREVDGLARLTELAKLFQTQRNCAEHPLAQDLPAGLRLLAPTKSMARVRRPRRHLDPEILQQLDKLMD